MQRSKIIKTILIVMAFLIIGSLLVVGWSQSDMGHVNVRGNLTVNGYSTFYNNSVWEKSNITAQWILGKYNWTTISNYISFDWTTLTFNDNLMNTTIAQIVGGTTTNGWDKIEADDMYINGSRSFTGKILTQNIVPVTNITYNLGNESIRFNILYVNATSYGGTSLIYHNGTHLIIQG